MRVPFPWSTGKGYRARRPGSSARKPASAAENTQECVVRATVDVTSAREKRIVRVPGKHVIDRLADRRPEMYGANCDPHALPRPGRDEPV